MQPFDSQIQIILHNIQYQINKTQKEKQKYTRARQNRDLSKELKVQRSC